MVDPRQLLSIPFVYSAFRNMIGSTESKKLEYETQYLRVAEGDRVLDIGCGTAEIIESLPASVSYIGLDKSFQYIQDARNRYGKRGIFYQYSVGNPLPVKEESIDLVIANGLLHHLTDVHARDFFAAAHRVLADGGRVLTLDGCFTKKQSIASWLLLKMDRGDFVRTGPEYESLARTAFSDVTSSIRTDLIRIPYTHIIMECVKHRARDGLPNQSSMQ